jgi:hypothetical protein
VSNDYYIDGCLPKTEEDEALVADLLSNSVTLPFAYQMGEMPTFAWDDNWEEFINRRGNSIEQMMDERTRCFFPWRVLSNLPDTSKGAVDRLYFSQGSRPSCMGHADDFAYRSSVLTSIAFGVPLIYEATNPYYLWWLSKGKSESGGQSVAKMSKAANATGHFLMATVGEDNTRISDAFRQGVHRYELAAKQRQSGLCFLPSTNSDALAKQIFQVCRAGFGVALGNSTAVNGTKVIDDIQEATLGGRWAHATSFTAWAKRKNNQYVFWTNSHGKIYKKATFGEPFDGAWMRFETVKKFVETALGYGQPYAVIPEALFKEPTHLKFDFSIPFPTNF